MIGERVHQGGLEVKREACIFFSRGAVRAEAAFGTVAQRQGVDEVNFTFEGHDPRAKGSALVTDNCRVSARGDPEGLWTTERDVGMEA
jgi:hypothetical protein